MPAILVDTNVLIYLYDQNSPARQERARSVLDHLYQAGLGRLSTQVLAEFVSSGMRKLDPPLSPAEAYQQVTLLISSWTVFTLTPQIVLEAIRGVRDHQLSYYDAQVWACARLNQIPVVFSEDFQDGQILEGVQFINPFADNFDLAMW
jgi:predicted nucleic acid-binding protein